MSSLAASKADEPPRKRFQPSSSSSASLFLSLPRDMVLNILARVPKRYYPILSCVSKNLQSLVRSPELFKTRSLLGKDSLYIWFMDYVQKKNYWYILSRTEKSTTDEVSAIDFTYPPESSNFSMIVVGSEIFFILGSSEPSSSFWILDTRSGEFRQGPSLLVKRRYNSVGLVGGKIYVIGGCEEDEIQAEVYDLKTQTWEAAPIPKEKESNIWGYGGNVSLDRKVYALGDLKIMTCYDTRDGSFERSKMPNDEWWGTGLCVIDNVLYLYFTRSGIMWYDSQLRVWRVVSGLDLGKCSALSVGMAEYYGKLAFVWEKPSLDGSESKEVWLRMIGLVRSEVGIHGTAEPSQLLEIVPDSYLMCDCLSISG